MPGQLQPIVNIASKPGGHASGAKAKGGCAKGDCAKGGGVVTGKDGKPDLFYKDAVWKDKPNGSKQPHMPERPPGIGDGIDARLQPGPKQPGETADQPPFGVVSPQTADPSQPCPTGEICALENTGCRSTTTWMHLPTLPERPNKDNFPNLNQRVQDRSADYGYMEFIREQEVARRDRGIPTEAPREVQAAPQLTKPVQQAVVENLGGAETKHPNGPKPSSVEMRFSTTEPNTTPKPGGVPAEQPGQHSAEPAPVLTAQDIAGAFAGATTVNADTGVIDLGTLPVLPPVENLGQLPPKPKPGQMRVANDPQTAYDADNPQVQRDMISCKTSMAASGITGGLAATAAGAKMAGAICAIPAAANPAAGAACAVAVMGASVAAGVVAGVAVASETGSCARLQQSRPTQPPFNKEDAGKKEQKEVKEEEGE